MGSFKFKLDIQGLSLYQNIFSVLKLVGPCCCCVHINFLDVQLITICLVERSIEPGLMYWFLCNSTLYFSQSVCIVHLHSSLCSLSPYSILRYCLFTKDMFPHGLAWKFRPEFKTESSS